MVAIDATKANCGMQYILRAFRSSSAAVIKYSELDKSMYNIEENSKRNESDVCEDVKVFGYHND